MRYIKHKSLSKEVVNPSLQSRCFLIWKADIVLKKVKNIFLNHFRAPAQKDLRNSPHLKLRWVQTHTSYLL